MSGETVMHPKILPHEDLHQLLSASPLKTPPLHCCNTTSSMGTLIFTRLARIIAMDFSLPTGSLEMIST